MPGSLFRRASPLTSLVSAFAAMIAVGCSLNYRDAGYSTSLAENTPDTVLYSFSTTTIHGKEPYFRIEAQKAETFNKKSVTILEGVKFEEFNTEGKVIATGSADQAIYHTDTQNAELSGHIDLYSDTEQARITAESLSWNNAQKVLTGKPGSPVTIVRNSGSRLNGTGLEVDLKTRTIKLTGNVQGEWVQDSSK